MRFSTAAAAAVVATTFMLATQPAACFAPPLLARSSQYKSMTLVSSSAIEDCGCDSSTTEYSGKPSDRARSIDPRKAIGSGTIYSVNGEATSINQLLESKKSNNDVSVVVLLRSLG